MILSQLVRLGRIVEAAHGPGPSSRFPEAALDGVGGTDHSLVTGRAVKEAKKVLEVALQAGNGLGGFRPPALSPSPVGAGCGRPICHSWVSLSNHDPVLYPS